MEDKEKYKLDDEIDLYDGYSVNVLSAEQKVAFHKYLVLRDMAQPLKTTWRDLLKEAKVNLKEMGSVFIIVERALKGVVYEFGNYDLKNVYKHGETKGYA